jgi:PEP-CTERM motif
MTLRRRAWWTGALLSILSSTPSVAQAAPLLINGNFDTGTFEGWSPVSWFGESSDGFFFIQSGTQSPISGYEVPAPPSGPFAAMSDQFHESSQILIQQFVVPHNVGKATLQFDLFIGNRAGVFITNPTTLDFQERPNQQARVDITRVDPLAQMDPFSIDPGDVLLNIFQTNPGDPPISGYTTYTVDLTSFFAAHAGEMVRLRFAEVDTELYFQLGVDNVSLEVTSVPEPASLLLLGTGLMACRAICARTRGATWRRAARGLPR